MEKINAYVCKECKGLTVTIEKVEGITPMFLGCRASGKEYDCNSMAVSMMYPPASIVIKLPKPKWEWYKPDSLKRLDVETADHVQKGGLLLRKIE